MVRPVGTFALIVALAGSAIAVAPPLQAQNGRAGSARDDSADTRPVRPEPLFTARGAILATLFTGASIGLMRWDERIARDLADSTLQGDDTYETLADLASLVNEKSLFGAALVTYGISRLAKGRTASDVAWHATEAIFLASAASTVVRGSLGRSRPFVSGDRGRSEYDAYDYQPGKGFSELAYRAYPSIHAAASFAAAAVVAEEVRMRSGRAAWVVTPLAYGLATLPGLGRMYNDKHWASDVLMGAFVGAFTGYKVVRWHHTRPGNRLDRIFLGTTVVPDGRGGAAVRVRVPF